MSESNDIPYTSPVMPNQVGPEHPIQFECKPGIGCWNACCNQIDITLTPYDVIRMRQRLGLSSRDFLLKYAVPFEFAKDSIAGLKFRTADDAPRCLFVSDAGCTIYTDRPTACRYYPVALLSMRKQGENFDTQHYAIVNEAHCLGHNEPKTQTIAEYRADQGVEDYDTLARGYHQLILKMRSAGPSIGKPSKRSLQLFFMACYDHDAFRAFINGEGFQRLYVVAPEEMDKLNTDDVELMLFGFRFLKQVMFGENTIAMREEERQAWVERKVAEQRLSEGKEAFSEEDYDPGVEPIEMI